MTAAVTNRLPLGALAAAAIILAAAVLGVLTLNPKPHAHRAPAPAIQRDMQPVPGHPSPTTQIPVAQ